MKKTDPRSLATDLTYRSTCNVQVAAVLFDRKGIFAWGHNHMGSTGFGEHAEVHALSRANRKRLKGASIAIAGKRKSAVVPSRPCTDCLKRLLKVQIGAIYIQGRNGEWERIYLA